MPALAFIVPEDALLTTGLAGAPAGNGGIVHVEDIGVWVSKFARLRVFELLGCFSFDALARSCEILG